ARLPRRVASSTLAASRLDCRVGRRERPAAGERKPQLAPRCPRRTFQEKPETSDSVRQVCVTYIKRRHLEMAGQRIFKDNCVTFRECSLCRFYFASCRIYGPWIELTD